jgi:hypothetical protein
MAMSLSLLGLRAPGIEIADPGCVTKTYPDFFSDLAALSSRGRTRPKSRPPPTSPTNVLSHRDHPHNAARTRADRGLRVHSILNDNVGGRFLRHVE